MVQRWVISILILFVLLLSIPQAIAACDDDGACEDGETGQWPACPDCNAPSCPNTYCDSGVGEDDPADPNYCLADCGSENGVACTGDGQCASGFCNECGKCAESAGSCDPGSDSYGKGARHVKPLLW